MARTVRREAGPKGRIEDLTVDQRRGLVTLVQLLGDVAGFPGSNGPPSPAPRAPVSDGETRRSRTFFVSGTRGAGKTTLLRSLINAVKNGKIDSDLEGPDADENTACTKCLKHLRSRLVWLDTIDLDPMPRQVNLLLSVLARLQDKFEQSYHTEGRFRGALLDAAGEAERLESHLRDLQHSVTAAWDMDVLRASQGQDLRTYAAAASDAEQARLKLSERLKQVLDGIAKLPSPRRDCESSEVLFVLPVDDFDLDPLRSIELLRLIRMLSAPNLVAIFLGDLDMAQEMLYYDSYGKIAVQLGNTRDPSVLSRIYSRASELASGTLRKLIPPSHRVYLEALANAEAARIEVRPQESLETCLREVTIGSWPTGEPPRLLANLESSAAMAPAATHASRPNISLWGMLQGKVLWGAGSSMSTAPAPEGSSVSSNDFIYQARELLEATPRQLVDLGLSFQGLSQAEGPFEPLVQQLVHLLHLELQEDPAVSFDLAVSLTKDIWLSNGRFVMNASRLMSKDVLSHKDVFRLPGDIALHARACLRQEVWVDPDGQVNPNGQDGASKRGVRLGKRAAAYLMLTHDLLLLNDRDRILEGARHEEDQKPLAAFVKTDATHTPWPHPFRGAFLEFQAFNKVWQNGLRKCRTALVEASALSSAQLGERLVAIWIHAGLFALGFDVDGLWGTDEFGLKGAGWTSTQEAPWEALASKVDDVLLACVTMRAKHQDNDRADLLERWLRHLVELDRICTEARENDGWAPIQFATTGLTGLQGAQRAVAQTLIERVCSSNKTHVWHSALLQEHP